MALLRPTRLLISEKSATYTIKWSYTIIWQVRVFELYFILKISSEPIGDFSIKLVAIEFPSDT